MFRPEEELAVNAHVHEMPAWSIIAKKYSDSLSLPRFPPLFFNFSLQILIRITLYNMVDKKDVYHNTNKKYILQIIY